VSFEPHKGQRLREKAAENANLQGDPMMAVVDAQVAQLAGGEQVLEPRGIASDA
jgi:hypothetical protein